MSRQTAWNWFESCIVSCAKVSKSFFRMASEISSILFGTTAEMRCWSKGEVSTVRCIPLVEDVPFLSSDTTQMSACISGQCSRGATWTAYESSPVAREPISQATNPPKRERHAEPEPWRAMRESWEGEAGRV